MYKYSILFMFLWLTACTTVPREVRYQFTPPNTPAGQVCLNRCQINTNQCNAQCGQQEKFCAIRAQSQAKRELPGLMVAWERDIQAWERANQQYQLDLSFWEMEWRHRRMMRDLTRPACRPDDRSCRNHLYGRNRTGFGFGFGFSHRPEGPGPVPKRPTLDSETARIQAATCNSDCGCATTYRQCYSSCGGIVQAITGP